MSTENLREGGLSTSDQKIPLKGDSVQQNASTTVIKVGSRPSETLPTGWSLPVLHRELFPSLPNIFYNIFQIFP